jgi:hypothetical protein
MNKFEKYIMKNGERLDNGCSRVAYLLNDKVYKIPIEDNWQGIFEQDIYESLPQHLKKFFPNPKWFGRIVEMDYVEVGRFSLFDNDYDSYDSCNSISQYLLNEFIEQNEITIDFDELYELFDFLESRGGMPEDIVNNLSNVGVIGSELKIVDWGWSDTGEYI